MTSTTSPSAVIDVMQRDIERASSEDEKNAEFKQGSGDVAQLYASGTPKSDPASWSTTLPPKSVSSARSTS